MTCASCTRHISDTVHWNSVKLYRKNTDIVKLCNVKLFFDLSKNCQKYVNFWKFCFLLLRHFTSVFNQGLLGKSIYSAIVQRKVIFRFVKKIAKIIPIFVTVTCAFCAFGICDTIHHNLVSLSTTKVKLCKAKLILISQISVKIM